METEPGKVEPDKLRIVLIVFLSFGEKIGELLRLSDPWVMGNFFKISFIFGGLKLCIFTQHSF